MISLGPPGKANRVAGDGLQKLLGDGADPNP